MLTSKNITSDTNPRIIFKIDDILKKADTIHNTITIGSRVITIHNTPISYSNIMLLAMAQIISDNPDTVLHFHIPNIEEQLKPVMNTMIEELLDHEYIIKNKIDLDKELDGTILANSIAKYELAIAKTIAEQNYRDAIQLIIESVDNNTSISYSDISEDGVVNSIIRMHNNNYGKIGHLLQCDFVRPFPTQDSHGCDFNIDQQPLYISDIENIDPIANTYIPDGKYIATMRKIDISTDSLDATMNLNTKSIIDYTYEYPVLGDNMIERCHDYINFANSKSNQNTSINVWFDTLDPINVISIAGIDKLAKIIVAYQMSKDTSADVDIIDTIKIQTTIENLIFDEIQSFATERDPNVVVIKDTQTIDYDFNDTTISDMKLIMQTTLSKKYDTGNIMSIKARNIKNDKPQMVTDNICHIADIASKYGIDLVKILI